MVVDRRERPRPVLPARACAGAGAGALGGSRPEVELRCVRRVGVVRRRLRPLLLLQVLQGVQIQVPVIAVAVAVAVAVGVVAGPSQHGGARGLPVLRGRGGGLRLQVRLLLVVVVILRVEALQRTTVSTDIDVRVKNDWTLSLW